MNIYQLSPRAIDDLEEILEARTRKSGSDAALNLKNELLAAFSRITLIPGLGHRRSDLTKHTYFFYAVGPYLIVYERGVDPLPILAVFHSARDVRKLLKRR